MSNAQATAAYTMGTSFLELIDVGAVADLVLVAFRWPHTGDKQYCYVQSITELSRECDGDIPTIVAALMTNIDETIAGGEWLVNYNFALENYTCFGLHGRAANNCRGIYDSNCGRRGS